MPTDDAVDSTTAVFVKTNGAGFLTLPLLIVVVVTAVAPILSDSNINAPLLVRFLGGGFLRFFGEGIAFVSFEVLVFTLKPCNLSARAAATAAGGGGNICGGANMLDKEPAEGGLDNSLADGGLGGDADLG